MEEEQPQRPDEPWERNLIAQIALGALEEQKRARRWNVIFKLLLFVYLFILLALYLSSDLAGGKLAGEKHSALVDIEGAIMPNSPASADNVVAALRAAFEDPNTKGVILRINSPGGSPVQAGNISDEIYRLRKKYPEIRLYAVITDLCASGGYYVASAADSIYADKASLVGSIGAVYEGFGFSGTLEKLGIERRMVAAGEHKGFLDPFRPLEDEEKAHVEGLLNRIHQQFINTVKKGRGDKLKRDADLFNGLVWTGEQSLELGLIDGLGSSGYIAREIIGEEKIVDFTKREDYFQRFIRQLKTSILQ
jgi:protease-4